MVAADMAGDCFSIDKKFQWVFESLSWVSGYRIEAAVVVMKVVRCGQELKIGDKKK